ncbi:hypothetical protein TNIN_30741 [Trichonephila inaurata madagascariensis]|uniref:Uncharacterized protein n=1 Tax=Trichonephila inaurata madagascariensis TaxID=2747483 RepID=A0A8X6YCY8_9ARAC|nr:hypothetical protein TNIN_30741 [Trichonephila inaurata madagascariensis]
MQPALRRRYCEAKELLQKNSHLGWRRRKNGSLQTISAPNQVGTQKKTDITISTPYTNAESVNDKRNCKFQPMHGDFSNNPFLPSNLVLIDSDGVNTFLKSHVGNPSIFITSSSKLEEQGHPFLACLKTSLTQIPENSSWGECKLQTDKDSFEMEEPELIDIFEKPFLLNNPFASDYLTNPFNDVFIPLPDHCKFTQENTNPFKDAIEEIRNSPLDSSEWQKHDEFFQKLLKSKRLDEKQLHQNT